jgi:hypothetical protein
MFVFLVHVSQVSWSIIPDLLDEGVGVGRAVSEKLAVSQWMIIAMGSVFTVSYKWKGGVRLG